MDNCLASNSETGGVGCDNMTMIIVALLRGKTKDEWYQEVEDRVSKGDGPCAPLEYGVFPQYVHRSSILRPPLAEFRGPGIKHQFEDSGDDYEMDLNNNNHGPGRIIFLGDGKEPLADGNEEDSDKDFEMHSDDSESAGVEESRRAREETPGPEPHDAVGKNNPHTPESENASENQPTDESGNGPTSSLGIPPNAIRETALPDKLAAPLDSQQKQNS